MVLAGNQGEASPGLSQLVTVKIRAPFLSQTSSYLRWFLLSVPSCNLAFLPLRAEEHSSVTKVFQNMLYHHYSTESRVVFDAKIQI